MSQPKSFTSRVRQLAGKLREDDVTNPDLTDDASVILVSIARASLAGANHVPTPAKSSVEKASVGACFMAACSVSIIHGLSQEGESIAPGELVTRSVDTLFTDYKKEQRTRIAEDGIALFQEIIGIARQSSKLGKWLGSVDNLVGNYIDREDNTETLELFAPLYLVLLKSANRF